MLSQTNPCLQYKSFKNSMGKGEIAYNKQFLFFPQFSTHLGNFPAFSLHLNLSSANFLSLEESKIFCLGIGLITRWQNLTISLMTKFTLFETGRVCR